MGLGFTLSLTVLGVIREFLGAGTVFGLQIYSSQFAALIFVLAPGAFICLAYLMAIVNKLQKK
jgi:electron transport complex protein RnfE